MASVWYYVVFLVIVSAMLAAVYWRAGKRSSEDELKELKERLGPVSGVVQVGEHVSGLPALAGEGADPPMGSRRVQCLLTEGGFALVGFPEESWEALATVPGDMVKDIHSEYEPPAQGAGRAGAAWLIVMVWSEEGRRRRAVFRISGPGASARANEALGGLKGHMLARRRSLDKGPRQGPSLSG
ncbi:MAG: hypothetical protein Kow0025_03630 [Thermodesulfovibrionales bacterium]